MPGLPRAAIGSMVKKAPKSPGEFNMGLGILGAFLGAGISSGALYAFAEWAGFRFPWTSVLIGVLTALGAKILYKGTSNGLGAVSAAIAAVAVVATNYMIFGEFRVSTIVSIIICVFAAYRMASG
jgi:hypothetical protein